MVVRTVAANFLMPHIHMKILISDLFYKSTAGCYRNAVVRQREGTRLRR
jgi:hypothetical protein